MCNALPGGFKPACHSLLLLLLLLLMLLFALLQAPIMAVEAILVKWAKQRKLMVRRPLAIFLTNFLLIVVANPLFFGPCDWSGMCTAMFDNVKGYFV
jgi:hypothetical protein